MVSGISHITFITADLDRMEAILESVFDARKIYDSGENTFSIAQERFFLMGKGDQTVWVATMKGESLPARSYNHVAFKIDDADYDIYLKRVQNLGLTILDGRSRIAGEGRSIYFYDDDNHLFELHTGTLEARLQHYRVGTGVSPR